MEAPREEDRRRKEIGLLLQMALRSAGRRANDANGCGQTLADSPVTLNALPVEAGGETLRSDLEVPIDPDAGGPFSLASLFEHRPSDFDFLRGRSLGDVFLDADTEIGDLSQLKDLGKSLLGRAFSLRAKNLGRSLYFCSLAAAWSSHRSRIGSLTRDEFRAGVEALDRAGGLPPAISRLCRAAAADFGAGRGSA